MNVLTTNDDRGAHPQSRRDLRTGGHLLAQAIPRKGPRPAHILKDDGPSGTRASRGSERSTTLSSVYLSSNTGGGGLHRAPRVAPGAEAEAAPSGFLEGLAATDAGWQPDPCWLATPRPGGRPRGGRAAWCLACGGPLLVPHVHRGV